MRRAGAGCRGCGPRRPAATRSRDRSSQHAPVLVARWPAVRTCGLEPSITGPSSFGFCGPARRSRTVRRRPQCGVHRLRQAHVPPQRRSHRPPAHRSGDELPQLRNPQAQPGRRGLRGDADDPARRPGRDHRQRRPDGRGRVPHRDAAAPPSAPRVCQVPVFAKSASASENSLIGSGHSLSVENNYGYQDPFAPHTGAITRLRLRAGGHQQARQRLRAGVDKPHRERPQRGYQSSPRQPRLDRAIGASASGADQPRAHGSTSPPPRLSPPPLSCHLARSRETAPPGDSGHEIRASPRSARTRYAAGTRQDTYLREHECGSRPTHRLRPAIRQKQGDESWPRRARETSPSTNQQQSHGTGETAGRLLLRGCGQLKRETRSRSCLGDGAEASRSAQTPSVDCIGAGSVQETRRVWLR